MKALYPYRSVTIANGQNQVVPASPKGRLGCDSLFTSWKIVFNPPDELHSYFCDAVTLQRVLDKFYIYGHLNLGDGRRKRRAVVSLITPASLGTILSWSTSLRTVRAWHATQSSTGALIIFQDHIILVHCGLHGGQRAPYLVKCTSYSITGTPCRNQSLINPIIRATRPAGPSMFLKNFN